MRDFTGFTTLDEFLIEEGIYEDIVASAIMEKVVVAINEYMFSQKITKTEMASRLKTSRRHLDLILSKKANITLGYFIRISRVIGRRLVVDFKENKS